MPDHQNLLARLVEHRVGFVVIGGFAAVAHGGSMLTQDVDICCDFSTDNLMRLQEAIEDLHPVHRMTPARLPLKMTVETSQGLKNLYLDTDYGPLGCLSNVKGIGGFPEVEQESVVVQLVAGACRILSIDALIKAKETMNRPRDKETVLQLRAIRERRAAEGS